MEFPAIPSLRFDNRTEFDALHFDTVDQNGAAFHVIAAKTAYTLGPCDEHGRAQLIALEDPAPLHVADVHHEDDIDKSVRYESDLAPFKPLCDVVVVGDAHAPANADGSEFEVSLRVQRPGLPAPLPERPQPLNPMMRLSLDVEQDWLQRVAAAQNATTPGAILIDKTLRITGERRVHRNAAPERWLKSTLRACSLGMADAAPWRISTADVAARTPLRYEYAYGGECRVETGSADAGRIPAKHRLTAEQRQTYPDPTTAPEAHDSCQQNPLGRGFAPNWFLDASRAESLPAPCIEYPDQPFTASGFWQAAAGDKPQAPAGMGYVGRGWLPRRELVGQVDMKTAWKDDEIPLLPKDFDFRYWNGAPADQQCPYMEGGEQFLLTNLCPANAPYARVDEQGKTTLSFAMPKQSLFLLGVDADSAIAAMPMAIDTVVIDLDAGQVELTWRLAISAADDFQEVRLHHANTPQALERLNTWHADTEPQSL
ncbi:hypothetical protein SAMN05518865_1127 [Duganella sp. CF458]|uniref:DUF2169 family type VI secretion system accessory protein n=1 Tax=Duganella sp. CF458 TaxID=1884368 RepID=UPI0008EA4270|nr:DUF2169 domain-containing protein [Duganella sp. CF458]SFG42803.1 hypothetical protein SAMN05518865_1127 [Duganella sp. CF458]